jgi:hypothetical protein
MKSLSSAILSSRIWQQTLARRENDEYETERTRFRVCFESFRDRVGDLATEIRGSVPELTLHDLTHLDSLWEMASLITGSSYELTPAEGFVLGGSILLHDLAMSASAFEHGFEGIKRDLRWSDLVHSVYMDRFGRVPAEDEVANPQESVKRECLFNLFRQTHAKQAENLALLSFVSTRGDKLFLIEDTEIRQTFGRIIGQIAHSHWWSVGEVEQKLARIVGAAHWCPNQWKVDPLKIACILRVADASHIDARRAPTFLKAITQLPPSSEIHWRFQEKLAKPYLREDSLVYTSGHAFKFSEAGAWWLCLETLKMIDKELRSVDALLADKGLARFAAKRVNSIEMPERLAQLIQTEGWLPINATVHVTDLLHVIKSLGGAELYGKNSKVPLRELIQNGNDAIRARRLHEKRKADFGSIEVSISEALAGEYWLKVADTGIGMSKRVMTDFLLDFGRSFWSSAQMQEEFPGLLAKGIAATGKYGIGFFSVFMIAERVKIFTRRADLAASDTLVLEFSAGLDGRPILRPATSEEALLDGGTHVCLKLKDNPYEKNGLLWNSEKERLDTLTDVCTHIAPALDVDLFIADEESLTKAVSANDWQRMPAEELLKRLSSFNSGDRFSEEAKQAYRLSVAPNIQILKSKAGSIVGRACITPGWASYKGDAQPILGGAAVIGGLSASPMTGIVGVLMSQSTKASRDSALPLVESDELARWATEQADLCAKTWKAPSSQAGCARSILSCGGDSKDLMVCRYQNQWVSLNQLASMTHLPDELLLVDEYFVDIQLQHATDVVLNKNVMVCSIHGFETILMDRSLNAPWPNKSRNNLSAEISGIVKALANAWHISANLIEENISEYDERNVGTVSGNPISGPSYLISKPRSVSDVI